MAKISSESFPAGGKLYAVSVVTITTTTRHPLADSGASIGQQIDMILRDSAGATRKLVLDFPDDDE